MRRAVLGALVGLSLLTANSAAAQANSAPKPAVPAASLPAVRDIRYPGVLALEIDASDLDRKIFWVKQTIPVSKAGPMVLLYPEWIMGNHAPRGPLTNYSGLRIRANGKPLSWTRDPVDVYAFRVDVPAGAKELQIEAQFLTPIESSQGGAMVTDEMLRLNWYVATLYPAGHYARQVMIEASVKLPSGWDYGTALETASFANGVAKFKAVPFDVLLDSPLIAGEHFRKFELDPGGRSRVTLNAAGDAADAVDAKPEHLKVLQELVKQADKVFGARHFDHYDFLLTVSDKLAGAGIEHQRSSDNGVGVNYFRSWDSHSVSRDLLAHEYTHSWNGKYRRPADLWTANFNTPMRNSLLWVYEGQTQYWGAVLAARAGFLTKQEAIDTLANVAGTYDSQRGRDWRSVEDTTMDPIITARRPIPWRSWQRSEEYYSEGALVWLDADTLIRQKSGGKRSLDDFAKAFFGMNDGDWGQLTYTFNDVVAALNKVEPNDWASFLNARINEVAPKAPLDGFARGGYKLIYAENPNELTRAGEQRNRTVNATYSIGLVSDSQGKITSVAWDSPAFKAGLTTAATIMAVNGETYETDIMRKAISQTKSRPLELLIRREGVYKTVKIDYRGGGRYPVLERVPGAPALLDDILKPR